MGVHYNHKSRWLYRHSGQCRGNEFPIVLIINARFVSVFSVHIVEYHFRCCFPGILKLYRDQNSAECYCTVTPYFSRLDLTSAFGRVSANPKDDLIQSQIFSQLTVDGLLLRRSIRPIEGCQNALPESRKLSNWEVHRRVLQVKGSGKLAGVPIVVRAQRDGRQRRLRVCASAPPCNHFYCSVPLDCCDE